jgi:DNA repair exonuclease SbcCD ATPase subunit
MLNIQRIKYKNILSAGNQLTEVSFTDTKTTLIVGANGNGKSLIITALIFALYGRSNRGTTKSQLVNSTNKKDCVVELEFAIKSKQYKVIRGISPNIFEIWVDGVVQNQLASVKDQQKYLEQSVLRMSYKTFIQVVVLGSNNFVPFMQLSSSDRRDLVEELLDIKIFSSMNSILKDRIKNLERKRQEITYNKSTVADKIQMQKNFIKTIKDEGNLIIEKKQDKINTIQNESEAINSEIKTRLKDIEVKQQELESISFSSKKLKQLIGIKGKMQQKSSILEDDKTFFQNNDVCPTCKQDLQVEFKDEMILKLKDELSGISRGFVELEQVIEEEETKENEFTKLSRGITSLNNEISNQQSQILRNGKQIKELEIEIEETSNKLKNQSEEAKVLRALMKDEDALDRDGSKCNETIHYFEFAHLLMKDGGIKTKIMQKYLPLLNLQINKYLQMMDFYINFTLDDEFNENVKTPIHEDFSYGSFSEGEKQKINLAILFAWRDIAKMKNSINCNLMILDETFDSSLDTEGSGNLLKILNYVIKDTNIFVISHRIDELIDKFDRVLEVKKINGFSKVLI